VPTTQIEPPAVRMNPAIKARWVAALRSGDYVQGRELLHALGGPDGTEPRFCCLGVLCDLAYRDGVVAREVVGSAGNHATYAYHDKDDPDEDLESSLLPRSVARWAGLVVHEGGIEGSLLNPKVAGVELTVWNDGEHQLFVESTPRAPEGFETIARLIQEYL
jgi:hypothetical protein